MIKLLPDFIWIPDIQPCDKTRSRQKWSSKNFAFVCNFCTFLENHHPSLEFDCGKAVLIIRCICLCAGMHAWALHIWVDVFSLAVSARLGRWEGSAAPLRTNDPWFLRCDQQTKLSSWSKTKGVMRGRTVEVPEVTWRASGVLCQCISQWGQTLIRTSMLYIPPRDSPPPPSSRFPSRTFCQMLPDTHLCWKWMVSQSPLSQGFTCKECSFIGWTD